MVTSFDSRTKTLCGQGNAIAVGIHFMRAIELDLWVNVKGGIQGGFYDIEVNPAVVPGSGSGFWFWILLIGGTVVMVVIVLVAVVFCLRARSGDKRQPGDGYLARDNYNYATNNNGGFGA